MIVRNRSWLPVLIVVGLFGLSCSSRPRRPIALAPAAPRPAVPVPTPNIPSHRLPVAANLPRSIEPAFDPVQDVIDKAEASFRRGEEAYSAGHLELAKQEFNAAVATILQSPVTPREDRRLQETFDSLVERIHGYEVQALQQGDGFAEPTYQPAPIDELETLTFPEDPQASQLVGEGPADSILEMPLVTNSQIQSTIKYFTAGKGRATLEASLRRSGRYRDMISRVLREEGVPQELIYLAQVESGFQPRARSYAAAVGMWQFLAWRGKEYGLDRNWWEDKRMDPEHATRAAARHLRDLYNRFGDWYLAMAAYHCGPECPARAVERTGYADFWELSRRRVLPATTRNYVPVIIALTTIGKNPEKYGIEDLELEPAWTFDTVTVTEPVDLRLVAEMVNTSVETIRELNPSLLRMTTPKVPEYTLRIPLATRDLFVKRIAMIPAEKRVFWRWHTVRHGESLSSIAKQFKTSVNAIAEVNNLDPRQPLFEAAELVIPVGRNGAGPVGPLAGPGERHRVERGETLSIIARKYSVTTEQLIAWNDLDGTLIRAGSALIVGPEEDPQPTRAANGRHVVRRNETLAIIARRYGVTVSQLMTWNNLRTTLIRVGDTLTVRPQGSPTATADGSGRIIATASASSPASAPSQPLVHRVRKGESLSVIAVSYNTSVEALRRNNLHLGRTLQVGDPVYISNSK